MNEKTLSYQFDNVQVDLQVFKVWKAGAPLPLEPKAFEVLVFLINHRGRLVEKNELLDAVWKETFVTPNALTRVIAHLRRTLGDDAKDAKYIETIKTRGYRFIAPVQVSSAAGVAEDEDTKFAAPIPAPSLPAETRPAMPRRLPALALALAGVLLTLAIFISWRAQTQPDAGEQATVLRTTQLTTTAGLDLHPAFSPDGGVVAYSSLRNGNFEIFVRQLAPGGREIQITTDGKQNLQPAWSPDGKLIAYHSRERRGIWLIPALGGVAKQLTEFGANPAWSPDGQWLAFQSDAHADISQTAFGALPPSTIWRVPARGGAPEQITKAGTPSGGHGVPTWSPDGRRLVFATNDLGLSEIWSVTLEGAQLQRVWQGHSHFYDPVFSPDGKYLFFSTASGNFRLWRLRMTPATGLPDGEPMQVANTGAALARHLTITPDGKRLAYSSLTMANNIGSVSLAPNTHAALSEPRLLTQDTNYRKNQHVFSPDGKTIAYNVWRMGADGEVWLMDADGHNARQLTVEPAGVLGWLPSGDQLALNAKGASSGRLLKADVSSGKQSPLTQADINVSMPFGRLAPDGRQIAFSSSVGGALNLWTLALADGVAKQLTFDDELMGFPSWSPDSQHIAVEVKRGDDCHIAIIPRTGGTPTQLTFARGQSWPGSWSPDGDKISFAGLRDGVWNVWWVSRRAKEERRVTNYTAPNIYVRYPAWSPRGNQIVYEYAETLGNIWMAELK